MTDDAQKTYTLAVGRSVRATVWKREDWTLAKFTQKLANPPRTAETMAEYAAMDKSERSACKDVGGYVAGTLRGKRRAKGEVLSRSMITLDLDEVPVSLPEALAQIARALPYYYIVHPTHSHTPAAPRLRLILPLAAAVSAEEYEPIARAIAEDVGLMWCDPSTFQLERLMFWPSAPRDMDYAAAFVVHEGPFVVGEAILARYDDWRDARTWPNAVRQAALPALAPTEDDAAEGAPAQDPREKPGLVGAFCRAYSVPQAIDAFLSEVYTPGETPERYTFAAGSAANGLAILEGGLYAYDHHATSPTSGLCLNAFDLVRLHRFGALDARSRTKNPTKLPSYAAMCALAQEDARVKQALFGDGEWKALLEYDGKGRVAKTINNIFLILTHDPAFAGKLYNDVFAGREIVSGRLPWSDESDLAAPRDWTDADTAGLILYMEAQYDGLKNKGDTEIALTNAFMNNKRHPVRDYLEALPEWDGVERVPTLLVEYLGAEDEPYTRAVTIKHLVAAVRRVMQPGVKYDTILILSGPQGIGKSSLIRLLCPEEGWFNDSLYELKDKDTFMSLQGSWMVEIPELAGFNKAMIESVKAFLSKNSDKYRPPYGKRSVVVERQCVFWGTTNSRFFLGDITGERRNWPVACGVQPQTKEVHEGLPRERDQIWAEAMAYYHAEVSLLLSPELERIANEKRADFSEEDPLLDTVKAFLEKPLPSDWAEREIEARRRWLREVESRPSGQKTFQRQRVTGLEFCVEELGRPLTEVRKADVREINNILANLPDWTLSPERLSLDKAYGGRRPSKTFVRKRIA